MFSSETKFHSGCGWPAFYAARAGNRVKLTPDTSHGMVRTEVTCSRCGSHLGHVFDDARPGELQHTGSVRTADVRGRQRLHESLDGQTVDLPVRTAIKASGR